MTKLTEWMKTHKRHMAAIAIAIVSFLIVAIVAFSNNENTSIKNEKSDKVTETSDVNSKEGANEEVNVDSEPADTTSKPADKPSDGNASSSSNTGNSSGSDKPSKPAHQHSWKQHTAQKWVSNMVTVPDYETQKVAVGTRYIFFYDGYTTTSDTNAENHAMELVLAGVDDGYRMETIYETKQVQVGSHQEDHGHNETYVDYEYCNCGARR